MSEEAAMHRSREPVTRELLVGQLRSCGLRSGQIAIAHSSLSSLGWVCGGAPTVIEALLDVLGPSGTLVMPTHTSGNSEPSKWRNPPAPEAWWPTIRASMPAFDPAKTPTWEIGKVAESFRTWPGASRSMHPAASFAAVGPDAHGITSEHALEDMFGDRSPLGRLYELDAHVLLLGVGHESNTSLHLAEARAEYVGKRLVEDGAAMLVSGRREWVCYRHVDWDSDDFAAVGAEYALEAEREPTSKSPAPIQKHGIGAADAEAALLRMRPLVDWAVGWFERNR